MKEGPTRTGDDCDTSGKTCNRTRDTADYLAPGAERSAETRRCARESRPAPPCAWRRPAFPHRRAAARESGTPRAGRSGAPVPPGCMGDSADRSPSPRARWRASPARDTPCRRVPARATPRRRRRNCRPAVAPQTVT